MNVEHYGALLPLRGPRNDMAVIAEVARARCSQNPVLLSGERATVRALTEHIEHAADVLAKGDMFVLSFSGHGVQLRDEDGDEPRYDQAWCMYDRALLDDELNALWPRFHRGVRILVVSDSCYSGTMLWKSAVTQALGPSGASVRGLAPEYARALERRHGSLYRDLRARLRDEPVGAIQASILLLAASPDDEVAFDGDPLGYFSAALWKVWNEGAFTGSYLELHARIYAELSSFQRPALMFHGVPDPTFATQPSFTLEPS